MATVLTNTPDEIVFCNTGGDKKKEDIPTLKIIAGDWEIGASFEAGIVFEIYGPQFPMLTAADARKLSKWLARAADLLDDVKPQKKKGNNKPHYESDDDDTYGLRYKN